MDNNEQIQKLMMENKRLGKENAYLKRLNAKLMRETPDKTSVTPERVTEHLSDYEPMTSEKQLISRYATSVEKIRLYRSLFRGRDDTYAKRWESSKGTSGYSPACKYEWQRPICQKPAVKCHVSKHRILLPLTDEVIFEHLSGEKTIGLYPLLKNDKCWFLAVDFDKKNWQEDVLAFLKISKKLNLPFNIERSRSGQGAHLWLFFSEPVPAKTARKLGTMLISKTLEVRHDMGLDSYDRLLPDQDTMPSGGFGNLIALPLQRHKRLLGNSVFVNEDWRPYPDQWLFLSSIRKLTLDELKKAVANNDELKLTATSPWPKEISAVLKNGIYIDKQQLPSEVLSRVTRLGRFSNPDFYRKQARRMSTSGTPRVINCVDETDQQLILPRGCLDKLQELMTQHDSILHIDDQKFSGSSVSVEFQGELTSRQKDALDELIKNDTGILSAVPGFGKTVVSPALIARRRINTLIVVHRLQLLDQWVEQLSIWLGLPKKEIGQIGGGKKQVTGKIDVAMLQSINGKSGLKSFITQYGQVIVDECHHVAAISFEHVLRQIRAKYVIGLTATPVRRDGFHPIIEMQCGPIRYRVNARTQSKVQSFKHLLILRKTSFVSETKEIQPLLNELATDERRNDQIFNDVLHVMEEKRKPIIITERVAHAHLLRKRFDPFVKNVFELTGQGKKKDRQKELKDLAALPDHEECLVIATGKYIGEGFDDPGLDTLFLVMPVSSKGILEQYVGRLHRQYMNKKEVRVYDYVDIKIPVLNRMFQRRNKRYTTMGYRIADPSKSESEQMELF
ncbi:TOTE conflict system archaeo-eukaryotic primase domain-containing protein [Sporolactobacillus vineae]|uniref:TOTE conflict system archaeo-eukaryotic primase domain-containing protein n=1 Tax=Sporolactobacillus vineae TaxID=444463 RepID=UPI000287DA12|nr:DEAD/DEAH box helicase [Sporolactobacillus vineae]